MSEEKPVKKPLKAKRIKGKTYHIKYNVTKAKKNTAEMLDFTKSIIDIMLGNL